MKRILITGSSGLIGSTAARYFDQLGFAVVGIDNNQRRDLLGPGGDTTRNLSWLKEHTRNFRHENVDIRSRRALGMLLASSRFDLIIHCAGQPSADLARVRPLDDFDINAVGTINLLEAARQSCPETPFITLSTSRVYGTRAGDLPVTELPTRYDYARPEHREGIDETARIDATSHTMLGASKLAADLVTQEYGHSYRMPTCVVRASCIIGTRHPGAPDHNFVSHLARIALSGGRYPIAGSSPPTSPALNRSVARWTSAIAASHLARSRFARSARTRSIAVRSDAGSTRNTSTSCASSVTYLLTPTTIRSFASTWSRQRSAEASIWARM